MKRRTRTLAALTAVAVAAAVLMSGPGYDTAQVRMFSGAAWLMSKWSGGAVLVDGASAELAATVAVAKQGTALSVTQQDGAALVLNQETGELSRVDGATRAISRSTAMLAASPGLVVKAARDRVYGVDLLSGMVATADLHTLAPIGEPNKLAAAIRPDSTVVDGNGRLWAIDDRTGDLVWLTPAGQRTRTAASKTGSLAIARGAPVLVDPGRGTAELLSSETGTVTRSVRTDLRPSDVVAVSGSADAATALIATGTRGELIMCSFDAGSCADAVRVGTPGADLGAPVEVGGHAVVPDYSTGQATIVDLRSAQVVAVGKLFDRPVRFDLIARDGIVFFNDPNGSVAGVLDLAGDVRTITKYAEGPSSYDPPQSDPRAQADQATEVGQKKQKPGLGLPGQSVRTPQTNPLQPPSALIQVSPSNRGEVGDEFELRLVLNRTGSVTTQWSFGDGTMEMGTTVRHSWREQGEFLVRATTTFPSGGTVVTETNVTVDPAQAPPGIDRIDVQRAKPVIGESVHFSADSSGKPEQWEWTVTPLGQTIPVATAQTARFDHRFTIPGRYTVSLTITRGTLTARSSREFTVARGAVEGWGDMGTEQLQIPPEASSGVMAIDAGRLHSLALKSDGSVIGWGENSKGAVAIPPEASSGVVAISAGAEHSLALKADGSVIAWGADFSVGLNDVPAAAKQGVVAIAAGGYHNLALKNGSVITWGTNWGGQNDVPPEATSDVVAISAGTFHSMALKADGTVIAWGWGGDGPCAMHTPVRGAVAIAGGHQSCMSVLSNGSVVGTTCPTWEGPAPPVPPTAMSGVIAVDTSYHSLALKADGSVIGWGDDSDGQATVPPRYSSGVLAVSVGEIFSLVLVEGLD
ncbi:PKD domain-containing protein [Lentzea sp. NPDC051208]|uniref:PKD domain-containing protein n=1 Tax=Lentzea sp. NPDC051208 TaxID=3154642 RepID=UPI003448E6A0